VRAFLAMNMNELVHDNREPLYDSKLTNKTSIEGRIVNPSHPHQHTQTQKKEHKQDERRVLIYGQTKKVY
jgi:hypothetical protein